MRISRRRVTAAIAGTVLAAGLSLGATAAVTAAGASAVTTKVIQNDGHLLARASVRPTAFKPGNGLNIDRIKWSGYSSTKAVGWGHFYGANGTSPVKVTFTDPVTSEGIHYFDKLFFQTVKMGGDSVWSWATATYHGGF